MVYPSDLVENHHIFFQVKMLVCQLKDVRRRRATGCHSVRTGSPTTKQVIVHH